MEGGAHTQGQILRNKAKALMMRREWGRFELDVFIIYNGNAWMSSAKGEIKRLEWEYLGIG